MTLFSPRLTDSSVPNPSGLPPARYLPIVAVLAAGFLFVMYTFLRVGFGNPGASLGQPTGATAPGSVREPQNVGVGGGPPAAVREQLGQLRAQIAAHPKDDVALVQLADLYLAVGKYDQAIPLYRRALLANPKNVAAKAGLDEARTATAGEKP